MPDFIPFATEIYLLKIRFKTCREPVYQIISDYVMYDISKFQIYVWDQGGNFTFRSVDSGTNQEVEFLYIQNLNPDF